MVIAYYRWNEKAWIKFHAPLYVALIPPLPPGKYATKVHPLIRSPGFYPMFEPKILIGIHGNLNQFNWRRVSFHCVDRGLFLKNKNAKRNINETHIQYQRSKKIKKRCTVSFLHPIEIPSAFKQRLRSHHHVFPKMSEILL